MDLNLTKKVFVQKRKKSKIDSIVIYDFVGWICLMIFADLNEDCNKVSKNEATEFEARKKFKNISDLSVNYLKEDQSSELARNGN